MYYVIESLPKAVESLLVAPFLNSDSRVIGVVELIRYTGTPVFLEDDQDIVESYLALISVALNNTQSTDIEKLNSALLEIFRYHGTIKT